ncbi:MAG: hypothetical protein A3C55_03630 [Gammaproteobacteria bacterium RIFCSPHIGHO2_02_FULL_42_13]|nr:MAG: hypothetical protein A3C55_03630 [Gammaproteobacteria bacterium RIFCSPHIGHO2_02_FULL_42_13]OGT68999.1 MAG: hypothetical protein A3H43_06415 [Gammaproteobacteria bacterium RIFCSPLOWO2_02_FULL_42_9]
MKKILLLTLILITPVAYAASYFFCNKTNQYVSLGNSLEQVQTNCGTPVTTTTKIIPNQKTQKAEQWTYNYKPNSVPAEPQKNALIVTFIDNKATNIARSGQTPPCRPDVQLKKGDSPNLLYQFCKQPSIKKTITQPDGSDQTQTIITYPNGQNATIQLTFIDGKLTGIE